MNKQGRIQLVRWLLIAAFYVCWRVLAFRVLAGFFLVAAIILGLYELRYPILRRWAIGCFAAALLTEWLPVDITLYNAPGPPHFVPYAAGLPSEEGRELHKRGEIYLTGSCFVFPNEPSYVLVW